MMSQQYSLRWNNHQPNFISMFTTLLNTQTLVDVTLAAEGRHLQAHKVVLSACSTYFQSLFVDNPSRHPIVILKDVTFADLRTMVDFMYYGEVNVTEEQLPKVLDTAKLLKIKGLTEMPDSTSLTRSQTTSSDLQSQSDAPMDPPRHLASPSMSPSSRRKRFVRRKSSSSSTVHAANDDVKIDASAQTDLARGDSITLSSLPPQQRRSVDAAQQTTEQPHLAGIEPMPLDAATNPLQEPSQPAGDIPNRKRLLKRQHRVMNPMAFGTRPINELLAVPGPPVSPTSTGTSGSPASATTNATPASSDSVELNSRPVSSSPHMIQTQESTHQDTAPMVGMPPKVQVSHSASGNRPISKQLSAPPLSAPEPAASPASVAAPESYSSHTLRRHESFPQDATAQGRMHDRVGYMAPGTRSSRHRQSSTSANYRASHTSQRHVLFPEDAVPQNSGQRAMHTPSMRPGPQLSCNYCWNTVGDNGRVLRRKTQFHCPECRTNLCIVPCFHEYHDGLSQQRAADNAR